MPTDGAETFEPDQGAKIRALESGDRRRHSRCPILTISWFHRRSCQDGSLIVTSYRGIWCPAAGRLAVVRIDIRVGDNPTAPDDVAHLHR